MAAVRVLRVRGHGIGEIAAQLGGPSERTLRGWCVAWQEKRLPATPRGRPPATLTAPERRHALEVLGSVRGGLSRDALVAQLPEAPVRAVRDLHRCWRRATERRSKSARGELHWLTPGRVMGLDLTDVPTTALEPDVTKLLYARDLGARRVHEPGPLADKSAATVVPAIRQLFETHGAPLVVKLDNEGTFRGRAMQRMLREQGVVALFSPPYYPQYNGSIEATIGAQKARVERIAEQSGRAGAWTIDDVLTACAEHNELSRPWGARGPTPGERFEARSPITADERRLFRDTLAAALRRRRRGTATIPAEHQPGRRVRTSATRRAAITDALVELGHLQIRRRRVTPAFLRQNAARIT